MELTRFLGFGGRNTGPRGAWCSWLLLLLSFPPRWDHWEDLTSQNPSMLWMTKKLTRLLGTGRRGMLWLLVDGRWCSATRTFAGAGGFRWWAAGFVFLVIFIFFLVGPIGCTLMFGRFVVFVVFVVRFVVRDGFSLLSWSGFGFLAGGDARACSPSFLGRRALVAVAIFIILGCLGKERFECG